MNSDIKDYSINSILLANLVFAFFPFSFLFGSTIINLNLFLLCCLGIYILRLKIIKNKLSFLLKIIFLFFIVIFLSTSLSFIKSLYFDSYTDYDLSKFIKSLLFFRYFLLLIIVYLLNEYKILDFKYFFYSAALASFFISLDVIYQYIFGFNIIGLKTEWVYNSSFFGDEKIAGGYIARFSFFSILCLTFLLKDKINIKFITVVILICVLGLGILLSGNRMPLILFLSGLLLAFLFDFKLRKIILVSFISLIVLFKFIISYDEKLKNNYLVFYKHSEKILFGGGKIDEARDKTPEELDKDELIVIRSGHKGLFLTAIDTWSLNKILGNGIKSFRVDCQKIIGVKVYRLCSNHPHNYYLEILTETGAIGLMLITTISLLSFFIVIRNLRSIKGNNLGNFVFLATIISLAAEMFPIKSTGSFFTTVNSTYIIMILSIFLCYIRKLDKKITNKYI